MNIKFTKLEGAGNDYIYIDAINDLPACMRDKTDFYESLSVKISDRHFGAGSDGIIIILPPKNGENGKKSDFRMRMFNADGSEGEMCGNGIRCFAKYVYDHNLTNKKVINIETLAGVKTVEVFIEDNGGTVSGARVFMGNPSFDTKKIPAVFNKPEIINEKINVKGKSFEISCVSMGNPHCVVFVEGVRNLEVPFYGKLIENNPMFPKKTNVEFVEVKDKKNVLVRTWERGSGETLACGTGACAVYSVMKKTGRLAGNRLNVKLYGGTLEIEGDNGIYMTGPAKEVFTGFVNFP